MERCTVGNINRSIIPQIKFLQSVGTTIYKDGEEKGTTYFHPSMIFPIEVELTTITFIGKKYDDDKQIFFATLKDSLKDGTGKPLTLKQYTLTHKVDSLYTTMKFNPPLILKPHQPFFFYHDKGELLESCIILGYKNNKIYLYESEVQ